MQLSVAILVLVSVTAVVAAHGDEPCRCYPDQMSGASRTFGRKLTDFYMDYDRNLVVEKSKGFYKSSTSVFDLTAGKKYKILSNGQCRTYDLTNVGHYARCLPDDASLSEDNEDTVSYEFKLDDGTVVVKTLEKVNCTPVKVTKSNRGRTVTLEYTAQPSVADDSVFDVDTSLC